MWFCVDIELKCAFTRMDYFLFSKSWLSNETVAGVIYCTPCSAHSVNLFFSQLVTCMLLFCHVAFALEGTLHSTRTSTPLATSLLRKVCHATASVQVTWLTQFYIIGALEPQASFPDVKGYLVHLDAMPKAITKCSFLTDWLCNCCLILWVFSCIWFAPASQM